MAVPSPPDLLVLLALRLTGLAEPEAIAGRWGLDVETDVKPALEAAREQGWVQYREGSFHGWALLPAGRSHLGSRLASELVRHRLRPAVADAYQRFLTHNGDLLALCTDWQLRDVGGQPVVNAHDDPDHDRRCIERLAELDGKVTPIVGDLADLLERFAGYGERLASARRRVEAGEVDYFTSPGVDSYHTVWFELHEHLLATLGLERHDERSDG